ncbi:MAG: hypothetical protein DRJ50_15115 [Actinobacteria bacterium]|nr:MAG: hypothetical protein DRJ50_15115 [Actinomycetota bacterium]
MRLLCEASDTTSSRMTPDGVSQLNPAVIGPRWARLEALSIVIEPGSEGPEQLQSIGGRISRACVWTVHHNSRFHSRLQRRMASARFRLI